MTETKKCTCLIDFTALNGETAKKAKSILERKSNSYKNTEITHLEFENTALLINRENGECKSSISLNIMVSHTKSKRPTAIKVIASFCPFCGTAL